MSRAPARVVRRPRAAVPREPPGAEPPRVIVLWCPDWPITAATRGSAGLRADTPLALIEKGTVFACSASARAEGVARGLRLREAQSRCPDLTVLDYDPALDARAFEPILAGIEALVPGVELLRPGVCAVRTRGAARYYGGERAAALALLGRIEELGGREARAGIADGIFTAEQAARRGGTPVTIVPTGGSPEFLSPLDVGLIGDATDENLVTLLRRLGVRTLGEFAALEAADVRLRFGPTGARRHALAAGRDTLPLDPRIPPQDLDLCVDFEPALDRVDQVAFGIRAAAEQFIEALTRARLVATAVRVELDTERGEFAERVWLHPRSFTPSDVVDRVRWQLQGAQTEAALSAGITRVRVAPEAVDELAHHETGLWGSGPDERIHHGLSRVQSLLGHGGVLVPVIGGGRTLLDRQQLVAWGDPPQAPRSAQQPWPGRLPMPLPGTVFATRHPVRVISAQHETVLVSERQVVSAAPAAILAGAKRLGLTAWAGPWPIDERWWSAEARRLWRFQAVDETGCAWLLVLEGDEWWAEARYD